MSAIDYIFFGAVVAAIVYSAYRDRSRTGLALKLGGKQFTGVLPFLVGVFGLIGLLEVFLTPAQVTRWLGPQQGLLAPLYASVVGGISAGPPAAAFPLGKYLLAQHAGVAAVGALLVSWTTVATATLPAEIKFFGVRFALTRWVLALVLSVGIGMAMAAVFAWTGWSL